MVVVELENFLEELCRLFLFAEAEVTERHYKITVYGIADVQVVFLYQQVWKRNGKVVDLYIVEQVLLSVLYEFVETSACLCLVA